MGYYKRLLEPRIWRKIWYERLTEPLHLNLLSLFVLAFGSFRSKVNFDLVVRQYYAYGILRSAEWAMAQGVREMTIIEFGVAEGTGLVNMSVLARKTERATGIKLDVVGFDSGKGMPAPVDYRDHPDLYVRGDFPLDAERLRARLPQTTRLVLGDVSETVPRFLGELRSPIGFVAFDLDYYSSTKAALRLFDGPAELYLPLVQCYFDDLYDERHNSWCGELLAIQEFNSEHPLRKIERFVLLENRRLFRGAPWLKHMFNLHVLDHPSRRAENLTRPKISLPNPYL